MGDDVRLNEFHGLYHGDLEESAKGQAVNETTKKLKDFVEILKRYGAGDGQICTKKSVPAIQFAVIGNVVFEFILDTVGGATEVHRARILRERILCERFVQTYRVLESLP